MQSEIINPEEVMSALVGGSDVLLINPKLVYNISGDKQFVSCKSLKKQTFESIRNILSEDYSEDAIFVKIGNKEEKVEEEEPNYAE